MDYIYLLLTVCCAVLIFVHHDRDKKIRELQKRILYLELEEHRRFYEKRLKNNIDIIRSTKTNEFEDAIYF